MLPRVKTFLGLSWTGLAVFGHTVVAALFFDAVMQCDQMLIAIELMDAVCHSVPPLPRSCEVIVVIKMSPNESN